MTDHLRPHDGALERLKGLHPKVIDLSLGRLQRLLTALDHPERRLPPVVHVAGTNGKGSTVAFARAIAEAAGLRAHVFTSPHLVRFAERIRLAGTLIAEEALAEVLARVEAVNAGAPITFFEVTAAAALLAMAETPADLAIIEVGLGGRFDATNVVTGAVNVITPVDYDHAEFLGTELAGIAREKAGIAKPGRPLVVAHQREEAFAVIEAEAEALGAPLLAAGRDFNAWSEGGRLVVQLGNRFGSPWADRLLDLPQPALAGAHQVGNAGLAVASLAALGEPRVTEAAFSTGVASASWPARLQRLARGPLAALAAGRGSELWLDGGHNPHAARALSDFARELTARDGRPVAFVMGVLARKDVEGMMAALAPSGASVVSVGFEAEAAADPALLAEAARRHGLNARTAPNVTAGVRAALEGDGAPPHVIVAGSLYLAGEVLALSPETWPS